MNDVYIATHQKQFYYLVQKFFIEVANQSQDEFKFHEIDIGYSDRQLLADSKKKVHVDAVLKYGYELKKKNNISDKDLFILFFDCQAYDEEDDDLFFITVDQEDIFDTPGMAIIATRYINQKVLGKSPSKILVANSILLNLLATVACYYCNVDTHMDTTGCVLDYCDKMEDIKYSIQNGFSFCEKKKCYSKMFANINGRAILKISTSLTNNRLEKINDLNNLIKIEDAHMFVLANPIWKTKKFVVDPKLCFVLMPFKEKFSDDIWELLQEIIPSSGLNPVRADDLFGSNVMEDIWISINQARLVVVEMTNKNANVFYELGIAHTLGKDIILIAQSTDHIPFDLNPYRVLIYSNDLSGYKRLRTELPKFIKKILSNK